ncbi:50S ribosomal protein L4 [Halorubrum sp. AJ67]|nr:50S ribosomal protein L4 [Halorubrum sp. AJ67]
MPCRAAPRTRRRPRRTRRETERQGATARHPVGHRGHTDAELVAERGHAFDEDLDLPLVVSDEFEDLEKTQEALSVLEAVGVDADIERSEEGRSVRAGQGKARGRKYRQPKSVLVVTSEEPSRAARNLAGVDIATAGEVNAEDLAPGAHPGRLTLWTESAVSEVADR